MSQQGYKKGREKKKNFFGIPKEVMRSQAFKSLPPQSLKIFLHMGDQYFGANNGDLRATDKTMESWGMSGGALAKWRNKLEASGLIVLTRKGKPPNLANLYGFTFHTIVVNGREEHTYQGNVKTPLNYWRDNRNPEYIARRIKPYIPPALKLLQGKALQEVMKCAA